MIAEGKPLVTAASDIDREIDALIASHAGNPRDTIRCLVAELNRVATLVSAG